VLLADALEVGGPPALVWLTLVRIRLLYSSCKEALSCCFCIAANQFARVDGADRVVHLKHPPDGFADESENVFAGRVTLAAQKQRFDARESPPHSQDERFSAHQGLCRVLVTTGGAVSTLRNVPST
jgi:hypothetical protein